MDVAAITELISSDIRDAVKEQLEDEFDGIDPDVAGVCAYSAGQSVVWQKHLALALSRIVKLEERLTAVEGKGLEYLGVHQRAIGYRRGNVVTCHGSAWVAVKDVPPGGEEPAKGSAGWSLMVQKGRDAAGGTR